jgi:glycosyltransferase involved in cell wall biosynthesis
VTSFALSAYPVSGAFRETLAGLAGEPVELLVLPELRRLGATALPFRLASLHGRCFIALEDTGSETLLPILETLAALTRARTIEVVRADGSRSSVRRRDAVRAVGGVLTASLDVQRAVRAARRELDELLAAPREAAPAAGPAALVVNANLWFGLKAGGSIAHVAGVVNGFAGHGLDVTLATATEPVGVSGLVAVRRLQPPRWFGLPVEGNLYRFGRSVPSQLADVTKPGFVYQRLSIGSYAGAAFARRYGVPFVLEYNGSEVWVARNWGQPLRYESLARAAEDASLRHAHLVVTISQALYDELIERGVEPERAMWHPNGVDPDLFADGGSIDVRARHGIDPSQTVVTFIGTFGQWHGTDVLARAIRRAADWARATGVHFLLVGDGLRMPDVRRELDGTDDIVTLTGLVPQADAPAYLLASDILVSPHVANADGSPFFGSPTKLFEYMAAGRAIVASDLDQIGDVLRDDLAVLVPPGDVEALADAIRVLAEDPERRMQLGERARRRVLERFTWGHHVDAILERLQQRSA